MTFQRYELKYLLNAGQTHALLDSMEHYMRPDSYGRTTIRNIYFDTEDLLMFGFVCGELTLTQDRLFRFFI